MRYWLSEAEVHELTGKVRPSAQRRVLKAMGYAIKERPDGSFVVPVNQFESRGNPANNKTYKLDFSGLGDGTKAA